MAEVKKKKSTNIKGTVKQKRRSPVKSLSRLFIDSAYGAASEVEAKYILLLADVILDRSILTELSKSKEIIFVTKNKQSLLETLNTEKNILQIPDVEFSRVGIAKVATMKALSTGLLSVDDKVVVLTGAAGLEHLDSLLVIDIGKEFEILTSSNVISFTENLHPEVFEVVMNLAIELGSLGREGKPAGTIFVIGDDERVMQLSSQMIINPFKGYSEEERNIISPELRDTVKEFSAMDGAFVIREDGVLLAAGRYLSAAQDKQVLPMGLGSRHVAAAGITSVTDATAIVVSESTGDVRIFKGGNIFMEIEKPVK
ncbi:MAG: DNA integrity scanning protein DisA nucleotide-binding domain protein [Nitrospinota bacterium]